MAFEAEHMVVFAAPAAAVGEAPATAGDDLTPRHAAAAAADPPAIKIPSLPNLDFIGEEGEDCDKDTLAPMRALVDASEFSTASRRQRERNVSVCVSPDGSLPRAMRLRVLIDRVSYTAGPHVCSTRLFVFLPFLRNRRMFASVTGSVTHRRWRGYDHTFSPDGHAPSHLYVLSDHVFISFHYSTTTFAGRSGRRRRSRLSSGQGFYVYIELSKRRGYST
jgi:hypothetical protein